MEIRVEAGWLSSVCVRVILFIQVVMIRYRNVLNPALEKTRLEPETTGPIRPITDHAKTTIYL